MKKKIAYLFLLVILLILIEIIQDNKKITISSEFTNHKSFTSNIEGPAFDKKGNLYTVNFQRNGTIGITNSNGITKLFTELPEGSMGNSIVINKDENLMFVADYTKHNILKIDIATKQLSVFVNDNRFNQPNDFCQRFNGDFYASDPDWKNEQGNLWLIKKSSKVILQSRNLGVTNGIALNPDHSILYVTELIKHTNYKVSNIWKFKINQDGSLSKKQLLIKFEDSELDGMKVDKNGNIYQTRYDKGKISVISPKGLVIQEINLINNNPSNIVFGGFNNNICFVTMQDCGCIETFLKPNFN